MSRSTWPTSSAIAGDSDSWMLPGRGVGSLGAYGLWSVNDLVTTQQRSTYGRSNEHLRVGQSQRRQTSRAKSGITLF